MPESKFYKKYEPVINEDELTLKRKALVRALEQEKFFKDTARPLSAAFWQKERERINSELRKEGLNRFTFDFRNALRSAGAIFKFSDTAKALNKFISQGVFDWLRAQYQYEGKPVNIETNVDKLVPYKPENTGSYLSFIEFWTGTVGFLAKEFGSANIKKDVEKFLTDMAGFYSEAGVVFRAKQSTRLKPVEGSVALRLIRKLVRPLNMFPSLHAEVVGHTLFESEKILNKFSGETEYENFRSRLLNRGAKIIESCLTTKQHGLVDIAGGFFAYAARTPGFRESGITENIISRLFKDAQENKEISLTNAVKVRESILDTYNQLFKEVPLDNKDYTGVLINFLEKMEKSEKTPD